MGTSGKWPVDENSWALNKPTKPEKHVHVYFHGKTEEENKEIAKELMKLANI